MNTCRLHVDYIWTICDGFFKGISQVIYASIDRAEKDTAAHFVTLLCIHGTFFHQNNNTFL